MSNSVSIHSTRIGTLDCWTVDTPRSAEAPRQVAIFCHGFGAPGNDLVPCGQALVSIAPQQLEETRFIFPEAPIQLDGGFGDARAWWPIDMELLQAVMLTGSLRDLRNDAPPLLADRRAALIELIEHLKQEHQLAESDFVLGGFSQGSMLATDVALSLERPPAGLVAWSGTLLNEQNWRKLADGRAADRRFPIFQSHGRIDDILPFAGAEWLRDMLQESGFAVDFLSFNGPHTIPAEALDRAAKFIGSLNHRAA